MCHSSFDKVGMKVFHLQHKTEKGNGRVEAPFDQ
jgi:hypothetical protein